MGIAFGVMKDTEGERPLDIHDYMVRHPAATFFIQAANDGPAGSGIEAGDMLVVDRSLTPQPGDVIIAARDGELRIDRLPENGEEITLWGVVSGLLRRFDRAPAGERIIDG